MTASTFNFSNCSLFGVAEVPDCERYAELELHYMLSSYLHGELYAKAAAFAALQQDLSNSYIRKLYDEESYHADLFQQYLNRNYNLSSTQEESYKELINTLHDLRPEISLLVLHLVIEPFGIGSLSYIKSRSNDDELNSFLSIVLKDETDHLAMTNKNKIYFDNFLNRQSEVTLKTIANFIDAATVAMKDASCPRTLYSQFIQKDRIEEVHKMALKGSSSKMQIKYAYPVLFKARKTVPHLVPYLGQLKILLTTTFSPNSLRYLCCNGALNV